MHTESTAAEAILAAADLFAKCASCSGVCFGGCGSGLSAGFKVGHFFLKQQLALTESSASAMARASGEGCVPFFRIHAVPFAGGRGGRGAEMMQVGVGPAAFACSMNPVQVRRPRRVDMDK